MSDNCNTRSCQWFVNQGAFIHAPCGSIEAATNDQGIFIPPTPEEVGEWDEDGFVWIFEDLTAMQLGIQRNQGQKKTLRCKTRCYDDVEANTLDISWIHCWDNPFHQEMTNTKQSCQRDFIYVPKSAICDEPDLTSDIYYTGTASGGVTDLGGEASETECKILSATLQSCDGLFCRHNAATDDLAVARRSVRKRTAARKTTVSKPQQEAA